MLYNRSNLFPKIIAEFVINLHEQRRTLPEFKKALTDAGAEFPESFINTLDRLIQKMNPKYKIKEKVKENSEEDNNLDYDPDEKAKLFPGLAMADDLNWVSIYLKPNF
jgi:ATP-dependent RNA helicase DHX8/PRP22